MAKRAHFLNGQYKRNPAVEIATNSEKWKETRRVQENRKEILRKSTCFKGLSNNKDVSEQGDSVSTE
jgi:hypothetical protein